MKKHLFHFALLAFVFPATGQTVFEYDKKGNQISRSRAAKASDEIAVSSDTTVLAGTLVRLTAEGGESYAWSTGEATPEIEVCPKATTCFHVTVRDACKIETQESVTVNVTSTSAAPEAREAVRFEALPNPASTMVNLSFDLPRPGYAQIRLINVAGDVLLLREFSEQSRDESFSLEGFPAGHYYWSLWFEGAVFTKQFSIVK